MIDNQFYDRARVALRAPEVVQEALIAVGAPAAASAYQLAVKLSRAYADAGGSACMVGGSVRDLVLGQVFHDIDLEVYGLPAVEVERIARAFGDVSDIGKTFAILKLTVDGIDIDIAMPRRESKIADGHRGFAVAADPDLDPKEAARRRDFTINALAADVVTGEIFDYFDGLKDLENGVLHVVDPQTFVEDPLRVLRALQFTARFTLMVDEQTKEILRTIAPSLAELPAERIGAEWRKLLLLAEKPSLGLQLGYDVGAYTVLHPDLVALHGTPQESEWHPEGDVWVHTLMVVDEAAKIIRREKCADAQALVIILGALCHDFGKPAVTHMDAGRIRSHGHEEAGVEPTRHFLRSLAIDQNTIAQVTGIVNDHMKPFRFWKSDVCDGQHVTDGAIRRLAGRISPATMCELAFVTEADYFGRGPTADFSPAYDAGLWLLMRAEAVGVRTGAPKHIIEGKELLALGFVPGPQLGQIITLADDLRDDKEFSHDQIVDFLKEVSLVEGVRESEEAIAKLRKSLDS